MKVKDLIEILKTQPLDHNILISAKGSDFEITNCVRMAYTTFIIADKTPYEYSRDQNTTNKIGKHHDTI